MSKYRRCDVTDFRRLTGHHVRQSTLCKSSAHLKACLGVSDLLVTRPQAYLQQENVVGGSFGAVPMQVLGQRKGHMQSALVGLAVAMGVVPGCLEPTWTFQYM